MSATIVVDDLSHWYKDVVALTDVTLEVGPGVTSLLGPNGAGKTTLLRVITGLARPRRGRVTVLGKDPRRDHSAYRDLGLARETDAAFVSVRARVFLRAVGQLHGLADADQRAADLLRRLDLDPDDPRPLKAYSKGMRQRVNVAQALVHDPQIVVLDEPLNGLDPQQRAELIEVIRQLGAEGRTVLVSSHVLAEVERLGDRVLVLAAGRLAAEGDFHAIRGLMDDRPHRLRIIAERPHVLGAGLLDEGVVAGVRVTGERELVVDTVTIAALRTAVAPVARDLGVRMYEVAPLDDDLESVFRYLVGRNRP